MMIPLDPVSSAIDILGQVPVLGHLGLGDWFCVLQLYPPMKHSDIQCGQGLW